MGKGKGFKLLVVVLGVIYMIVTANNVILRMSNDNLATRKEAYISTEELKEKLKDENNSGYYYDVERDVLKFTGSNGEIYVAYDVYDLYKKGELESNIVKTIIPRSIKNYKSAPLRGLATTILMIGLLYFVMIRLDKVKKSISSENQNVNTCEVTPPTNTLEDVKGHDEILEDIRAIVEFIKTPLKYEAMGARLPKGALLFGPPGTGKTLLAKAIAGEAGVNFIEVSGSDFVEKYVGVGARRVRELFSQARKLAPCIVFIDEIDAIGRARGAEDGNSERDNTLNALLTEMDGFEQSEGIFILASTNRIEMLDRALTRAGRFDKHISVNLPDVKGREEILKLYAKNKPLSNIDLKHIAKLTTNFSGADLENLLNEAAILAVRAGKEVIEFTEIDKALYTIQLKGYEKKEFKRSRQENLLIAYHEAGHTLASILLAKEEVTKVTIIPSTSGAGGVTFTNPKDTMLMSKLDLENKIRMLYAGRAAELILTGSEDEVTTGAHNDIERATSLIYRMVTEFGMHKEFGIVNMNIFRSSSDRIEKKVRELSITYYNETVEFIKENEKLLKELAQELIIEETLYGDQIIDIIEKNLNRGNISTLNLDGIEDSTSKQIV